MIKSTSDIMLLRIGRVLISDDKSAFWHCPHSMSNTNVARIRLFGVSDTLAGFPSPDNQINISRLISFLGGARSMILTPTTTTDVKSKTRDLRQRDPKLSRLG